MTTAPPEPPVAAPASAGGRGREEAASASALNVIAGIWLILSPWILGYTGPDAAWNPIVCGALVVVLAGARALGPFRAPVLSFVNAAIGVWLFVSGFWLASSGGARWNDWVLGVIVFVLGLWSARATDAARTERPGDAMSGPAQRDPRP